MNSNNYERELQILEELEQLAKNERLLASRNSFILFITTYLKHLTPQTTPNFHKDILNLLQSSIIPSDNIQPTIKEEGGDAPIPPPIYLTIPPPNFSPVKTKLPSNQLLKRLLFIAPRGFAKSTLCSVFFPLWLAVFSHETDIFVVSATISLAKEHLRKIRNELENNELFLSDFGEMKSDKWTEDFLMLNNGVVIRAKGRGFQIRGFRPDMIICDDLEDEEIIYSKEQRDKLEHWFFRTLLPALKPNQNLVYIGTKIHQFSLIGKLQDKSEFLMRYYRALVDGKSIWEELWTTEYLNKLRKEIGEYAFQAEYQNNPISLEDQPIKFEYLEGVKIEGKPNAYCLAIDPAISEKETSDYRAISLFAMTENGFREVFSDRGRWSITEQINKIIDIWQNYELKSDNSRIVIESVAFQKIFKDNLIKEARKRDLWLPVSEAELGRGEDKRPRDKLTRLLSVAHLFEQRLVEIKNPDLFQELLAFPFGDHDDMVDACVFALYWLMNYRKGKYLIKKSEEKQIEAKRSPALIEVRPGVWISQFQDPPLPKRSGFYNLNK